MNEGYPPAALRALKIGEDLLALAQAWRELACARGALLDLYVPDKGGVDVAHACNRVEEAEQRVRDLSGDPDDRTPR